ncbi:NAD(P)-binding protein [Amniculicola lignicola CBS 123094]|uniref:NAD(P)-binding protein n=1 Tax=Amniculicola lignicola CBS 123094 TaxID=1392246 RepID=A0A6A5WTN0_9PLEO|nr:NAD(P)-binding protein [Amniculicola lignicola CBS 123094]
MTKLVAVTGATGAQGGSVVNILLKTPGWKVRAVTRNPESDKGKALTAQGVEVVQANFDDEESLVKAFEGANAVFGVTNFWEHLFTGKSQVESGEIEAKQALTLARAVAKTSTVEHYIWSTLPSARKLTDGKVNVAHCDYKADVDDIIKSEFPDLAKKTTFLFFGYYSTNIAFFPFLKPFEVPNSYGKYMQMVPTPATTRINVTGEMSTNPGIWVRQILAKPELTKGRYADCATDNLSFGEMVDQWSEVSGKQGVYVECSAEDFENIYGIGGKEFADQLKFNEVSTNWDESFDVLTMEELGISKEEAAPHRKALKAFF